MGRQPPFVIPLAPVLGKGPWLEWLKHELASGPPAPDVSLALDRCIGRAWRRREAGASGGARTGGERGDESP